MKDIQITHDIFEWNGNPEILKNPNYKVCLDSKARILGLETGSSIEGIIILGDVEVIVDSIIYTKSHGAIGNTTNFTGTNLVIFGLSVTILKDFLVKSDLTEQKLLHYQKDAENMLVKLKKAIKSHETSINIDNDDEIEFIIFGRRNFLLVGGKKYFVLIHNKQIAVRKGDSKLVQIDPHDGILIAEKNKVLNIGGSITKGQSILGELGVNLAAFVLDNILWD
ncbi:MAG: hypothetical protein ACFFAU_21450 [Candidatus Hodarchaeota archaeon]